MVIGGIFYKTVEGGDTRTQFTSGWIRPLFWDRVFHPEENLGLDCLGLPSRAEWSSGADCPAFGRRIKPLGFAPGQGSAERGRVGSEWPLEISAV